MSIQQVVYTHLASVAQEQRLTLAPLSDDLVLLDSGLDSLGFAILAARLEDALGVDPFAGRDEGGLPVTLGDFVQAYEHARAA